MTATNHVLTGMVIGTITHNPWLALPAALASHFIMDALPHSSPEVSFASRAYKISLLADMSLAAVCLLTVLLLQPTYVWLLLSCGILAASPDLMWIPDFLAAIKHQKPPKHGPIARFHGWVQWYQKRPGYLIELAWLGVMVWLLMQRV